MSEYSESLCGVYDIQAVRYPRGFRKVAHKLKMEPGRLAWLVFHAMAEESPDRVVFIESGRGEACQPWFRIMLEREQQLEAEEQAEGLLGSDEQGRS